jgi:hypothetical protein
MQIPLRENKGPSRSRAGKAMQMENRSIVCILNTPKGSWVEDLVPRAAEYRGVVFGR